MLFSSHKNRCDLKEHLHFGAELRYLALDTRIQKYCYLEAGSDCSLYILIVQGSVLTAGYALNQHPLKSLGSLPQTSNAERDLPEMYSLYFSSETPETDSLGGIIGVEGILATQNA